MMSVADSPMVMTLPGSRKAMVRVISSSDRTPDRERLIPGGLFLWLQKTQRGIAARGDREDVRLQRGVQDEAVELVRARDSWRSLGST